MQRITLPCLALVAALAAGCSAPDANKTAPAATINETVNASANVSAATEVAVVNDCAKVTTKDWKAWVDTMPGPGSSPTLHVTGQATTPTSGWTVVLNQGPLDKALPPTQHFALVATAPTGPVQQVITTQEVKAEIKNAQPKYKAVAISCDGTGIATIPVEIVS